ncbi:unnamed protein product [Caenorhabditis bovis]|uniref:Uncharacterized protein n=1 Tax=Caenorhabditis bovis TaxID=2654633 RepID=A0A8S1FA27_9PELO|nr:unnamed protein product [Caenorhabditis bovis]
MLEDLLYEIIPVIGFIICSTSLFTLYICQKINQNLRFCQFFAICDLLCGIAAIYSGFHGVLVTIYGSSLENVAPFDCIYTSLDIPLFFYTDFFHIVLLCFASFDRFVQILIPVSYGKTRDNSTIRISNLCRFDDVIGDEYYLRHILTVQWAPIGCLCLLSFTLLIYCIRQSKHRWSYNWSENTAVTKQLFASIFIRCFLTGLSVHVPLLFVARTVAGYELQSLRDHIIRISFWVFVIICQPLWHLFILSNFQNNVHSMFNKYSENTERKWQSATDPPPDQNTHYDRHGSPNPFGSWYSTTGNIAGEAGVPIGNERSVSFYYDA